MQTCPKLKINNAGLMFCFFLASISLMLFREHRLTLEISYILPCKTRAYFVSTPFPLSHCLILYLCNQALICSCALGKS